MKYGSSIRNKIPLKLNIHVNILGNGSWYNMERQDIGVWEGN